MQIMKLDRVVRLALIWNDPRGCTKATVRFKGLQVASLIVKVRRELFATLLKEESLESLRAELQLECGAVFDWMDLQIVDSFQGSGCKVVKRPMGREVLLSVLVIVKVVLCRCWQLRYLLGLLRMFSLDPIAREVLGFLQGRNATILVSLV